MSSLETYLSYIVFMLLGTVCLLAAMLLYIYRWIKEEKRERDEERTFVKLMTSLYEQEKQKNEKIDEGGFGS